MEKQEFQVGDTMYCIDEDYREFEDRIVQVSLLRNGSLKYMGSGYGDFNKKDIGRYIFKTKEDRENFLCK